MRLHLVNYGCGDHFDPAKFEPVKNRHFVKPAGGLWASPVNSRNGWREWATENMSEPNLATSFRFYANGNILVINDEIDAAGMPWKEHRVSDRLVIEYPDFETLASIYDAVWLTDRGEAATRWATSKSLYGWDCESVLIMNPRCVEITKEER